MDLAELGMCTKVTLEGIPEWSALKDVCSSLAHICRGPSATYASLEEQLKLKGISSRDQDGLRVSKETLRSRLRRCGHKVSMATKQRRRKSANVHELRKRVLRGGGSKIVSRRPKMSLRCLQDCPRSDFQSKSKEK